MPAHSPADRCKESQPKPALWCSVNSFRETPETIHTMYTNNICTVGTTTMQWLQPPAYTRVAITVLVLSTALGAISANARLETYTVLRAHDPPAGAQSRSPAALALTPTGG
ncbi:hypothetical protein CALCODRAFT_208458 [Calocera cornea HHB12733]|uniref:Uncharacterized protein n=1 Tax=Calocera cornea HHB12733 TaxID=1353952 RepID=A0A165HD07_9BASI|nr:hypothetical protein CALCODRAFT_208458 [Calocera cornea HHB12733]